MSEFIYDKEKYIEEGGQIFFENNTDSSFGVETGIIFHKSGLYNVDISNNHIVVSKIDERKAIEEAYQKGFEVGQHEATTLEYQQGLNDAWKAAKKIFGYEFDGGLPVDELRNAFGFKSGPFCTADILRTNTASEAIAKLKAYEEQKKPDEIKVGDEVTPKSNDINWLGVVVGVDDTNAMVMTRDGYTAMYRLEILKKTGRHFPQVAELLEQMKGGAE